LIKKRNLPTGRQAKKIKAEGITAPFCHIAMFNGSATVTSTLDLYS